MKIRNLLIISILMLLVLCAGVTYAQNKTVNKDSLQKGGIYTVLLKNGSCFSAEYVMNDSATFTFRKGEMRKKIPSSDIKEITIANDTELIMYDDEFFVNDMDEENPQSTKNDVKYLSLLNAGIIFPSGNLSYSFKTGACIYGSLYYLLGNYLGIGPEIQIDYLPVTEYLVYHDPHSNANTNNILNLMLKLNMMIGNMNADSKVMAYGLFGGGLHYFDFEAFGFMYNIGAGASYKLTPRTGLNINLEYNDLGSGNYRYYGIGYEYESESNKFYTLTVGISYFMK